MTEEMTQALIHAAMQARLKARAGKSGFRVGAALLTHSGEVITGCNVELNNTLMSICAERCAVCRAVAMGHTSFRAIAVVSDSEKAVAPCGICRQFLLDFGADIQVIMANVRGEDVKFATVGELSPMAFTKSNQ